MDMMTTTEMIAYAKDASYTLTTLTDADINSILCDVAEATLAHAQDILRANQKDLDRMDKTSPLYDRLQLTTERLQGIASDMRKVSTLPSPLGRILKHITMPNGLDLKRVSVPFGVIGIVYEARPNVTFDVFALCLKAGSACVLKGGKDADESNRCTVAMIKDVLRRHQVNEHLIELLPATHEATAQLLHANGQVDLVIPRGSKRLINFVRAEATVPVIETGAGVCHTYFDKDGDLEKGKAIVCNAKTRRPSVCNTLDTLLIHADRLSDLAELCAPMAQHHVMIYADAPARAALSQHYPEELLAEPVQDESLYDTEWMDYKLAIRTVENFDEALLHIRKHGSGHSECIVTENQTTSDVFLRMVDAACVYSNAPTSFTDGGQFGLGAEIGISTQKLHARGPMALEEITTYKWLIHGNGQVRK